MERYMERYRALYAKVYGAEDRSFKEKRLSNFVAMRGARYDDTAKTVRLMVVGRAVNGWGKSISIDDAERYALDAKGLFERKDRFSFEWKMKDDGEGPYSEYYERDQNGEKKDPPRRYYLSRSPFFRSSFEVYRRLRGGEVDGQRDLYEDIAWSNLYKIAPENGGNPSNELIYAQAKPCVALLGEEIRLLDPTHILLAVDKSWMSWASRGEVKFDFMEAFGGIECRCRAALKDVNRAIVQCAFKAGSRKVVVTCRPEQIAVADYSSAVCQAFKELEKRMLTV